jgi:hypothetical protein
MKKTFSNNDAYFKWFNKNLDKINILKLVAKNVIIVSYERATKL